MSWSFLLTSLIVVVSPGTGVLYTLATALTRGSRASVAAAFGCTLGILPAMCAAMLGLAAVLHTSALAFAALKWLRRGLPALHGLAGAARAGRAAVETRLDARSSRRVIVTGFLINILNPKLSIFFLAFLPQFIAADEAHPLPRMLELSAVFMAMTFVVFVLYGLFAGAGARPRREPAARDDLAPPRLCRRLCAAGREAGVRGALGANNRNQKGGPSPPLLKSGRTRVPGRS